MSRLFKNHLFYYSPAIMLNFKHSLSNFRPKNYWHLIPVISHFQFSCQFPCERWMMASKIRVVASNDGVCVKHFTKEAISAPGRQDQCRRSPNQAECVIFAPRGVLTSCARMQSQAKQKNDAGKWYKSAQLRKKNRPDSSLWSHVLLLAKVAVKWTFLSSTCGLNGL